MKYANNSTNMTSYIPHIGYFIISLISILYSKYTKSVCNNTL